MRKVPLALILALPAQAFASGGEVLSLLWLEFALFVAVVVSLIFSRLPFHYRIVIFSAYCLGHAVAFGLVGGLPYVANRLVVNLVSVLVPLTLWLAALVISKRSCKPNNSFKGTPIGAP
jgi:hypothetical protein